MQLINFFILQWLFVRLEKYEMRRTKIEPPDFYVLDDGQILFGRQGVTHIEIDEYYIIRFFAVPFTGFCTRLLFLGWARSKRVSKVKKTVLDAD